MSVGASRRVRVRPAWRASSTDEEARAFLQQRLSVYSGVLFVGLGSMNAFFSLLYQRYPQVAPALWHWIFGGCGIALALLGGVWRLVLLRRRISERALYRIDICYAILIGNALALAAVVSPDRHASGYSVITETIFAVFARAILVPSSGRRTAVVATVSFIPIVLGALELAIATQQDVPGPAYFLGAIILSAVAVLLATVSSRVIYGLRRLVSQATQLGQYVLEDKIGEGGIGSVYRARHVLLRRPTAIKLLRADRIGAETLDRFEREVQHTSQLTHPNTVAVFDYGRSDEGVFYYAMELLDGLDLEHLVRRYGPISWERAIDILIQVSGALQEAHDRGIVHRDVKPANIILCEHAGVFDVAKVVDFGLVKEITHDALATSENLVGTPAYVAPETITNPRDLSPAADQYALGAVGYFLLAGRCVFEGHNSIAICLQHITKEPTPLRELAATIPLELEAAIMRCLRKQPDERFASTAAFANALRAIAFDPWSEESARTWWAKHRSVVTPSSTTPTLTVTVDLVGRP